MTQNSFLKIIDSVDTFPYNAISAHYLLKAHDGSTTLGYLTPAVAKHFCEEQLFTVNDNKKTVTLSRKLDTIEKRNSLFLEVATKWRKIPEYSESLDKGWRNELYTVYNPTHVPYMQIERSFSVLIGVITYGVHINGYVPADKSSNGKLKIWIPRRAANKPTYPGMLDNTVAGGLGYPYGIWETVIKECFEEAGLSEDFVTKNIKSTGVVLYMYEPDGHGGNVQPEVEYTYDLIFESETNVVPQPEDGEAENFTLMDVDDVLKKLHNDEFKPNCGLIITDFLVRHGYITPSSDPNYLEILARCHRKMPFPTL